MPSVILPKGCTHLHTHTVSVRRKCSENTAEGLRDNFSIVGVGFSSYKRQQQNAEGMTRRRRKLPKRANRDLILVQSLCQTSRGWQLCSCACWYANTLILDQLPRPGTGSGPQRRKRQTDLRAGRAVQPSQMPQQQRELPLAEGKRLRKASGAGIFLGRVSRFLSHVSDTR